MRRDKAKSEESGKRWAVTLAPRIRLAAPAATGTDFVISTLELLNCFTAGHEFPGCDQEQVDNAKLLQRQPKERE